MKDKEYLCRCNKCDTIMFDENPSSESLKVSYDNPEYMIQMKVEDVENEDYEIFWACPKCKTDAYLIDITNEYLNIINE